MESGAGLKQCLFLFWTFFKGMMFAFTGGMAAMPIVERDLVDRKKWLTEKEFWSYPALAQSLPGVIGLHTSIMIGNRIAGPFGAVMAALGVITPAFVCMLIIAALFQTVVNNPYIQGMIRGIRAIAVAIILGNAGRLLKTIRKDMFSFILVVCAVTVPLFFGISAFRTILACGLAGIISVYLDPKAMGAEPGSGGQEGKK